MRGVSVTTGLGRLQGTSPFEQYRGTQSEQDHAHRPVIRCARACSRRRRPACESISASAANQAKVASGSHKPIVSRKAQFWVPVATAENRATKNSAALGLRILVARPRP